jgi:hypothetical protein
MAFLRPIPGTPCNVVTGLADQRLVVRQLVRIHTVLLEHRVAVPCGALTDLYRSIHGDQGVD